MRGGQLAKMPVRIRKGKAALAPESAPTPFPCARQRRWTRVGAGTVAGTAELRGDHGRPRKEPMGLQAESTRRQHRDAEPDDHEHDPGGAADELTAWYDLLDQDESGDGSHPKKVHDPGDE